MLPEVSWLCLWGAVLPNLACGSAVADVGLLCWQLCFYSAAWRQETSCPMTWALTNPAHPLIDCSGITRRRTVWLRIMQRDPKADHKIVWSLNMVKYLLRGHWWLIASILGFYKEKIWCLSGLCFVFLWPWFSCLFLSHSVHLLLIN